MQLISRFQSAGLIDKWLKDILHEAALKSPSKEKKRRRDRALSLDNMKLLFIIFFCGHFFAFISCCVENGIIIYHERKGMLLKLTRKISILSFPSKTPAFVITDTQPGGKTGNSAANSATDVKKGDKMDRLKPPPDPDAVMPYYDEEE